MDSYLSRFEKYTVANKWDRIIWAVYLSVLLKGRALEVYDRLSVADANDYEKLKDHPAGDVLWVFVELGNVVP